jgi:hypothetical protein
MNDGFQTKGYIKLYREINNNDLWLLEPFTKAQAWVDLLLLTNYKRGLIEVKNGSIVPVERGECGYSMKALAERWKWSRKKVAHFIKFLNKAEMVQQKIVENHSIITITNYELYQGEQQTEQQNDPQNEQQNEQQILQQTEQQTEQQKNTNNKDNKVNKDNKEEEEKRKNFVAKSFFQKLFTEDEEIKEFISLKDLFIEFLEYKTAIKKQYKTENSVRKAFMDFVRLSQNDENYARALVDNAIARGWQSIYDLPKEAKQAFRKAQSQNQNQSDDWESRCM